MKEKGGEVFSIAKDNQPVHGCTISKEVHSGENYIAYFSLAKNTDISAEIYPYHKLLIVADGSMEELPERPAVITNYPMIDEKLGELTVDIWDLTWRSENRFLDYNTRLLLSLANAVGAGRTRQAMRELLKAYANGLDSRALDDVFEQFAWNMGIGFFSSEIAPSPLFQTYKTIKQMEKQGKDRAEINKALKERFADAGHGGKGGGC